MKWDGGLETRPVARLTKGFNRSGRQLSDGAHGFVFPLSIPVCPLRSNSIPPDQTICPLISTRPATGRPKNLYLALFGPFQWERGVIFEHFGSERKCPTLHSI